MPPTPAVVVGCAERRSSPPSLQIFIALATWNPLARSPSEAHGDLHARRRAAAGARASRHRPCKRPHPLLHRLPPAGPLGCRPRTSTRARPPLEPCMRRLSRDALLVVRDRDVGAARRYAFNERGSHRARSQRAALGRADAGARAAGSARAYGGRRREMRSQGWLPPARNARRR